MVTGVFSIPLAPAGQPVGRDVVRASGAAPPGLPDFIAGSENRLVGVAVEAVARGTADYNPLLFVGGAGAGKSHLARGLAARGTCCLGNQGPSTERVVTIDAEAFCRELARLRQPRKLSQWRTRLRGAELLVIEDVHLLGGHVTAQFELVATIDALLAAGGQLVATSRLLPDGMPNLSPTLRGRLSAGLVVTLSAPECAARLALLQAHANRRSIALDDAAATILAEGLAMAAGELLSALETLADSSGGTAITAEMARAFVANRRHDGRVRMGVIAGHVARRYRLKIADLKGPSRRRSVASARALTMYLCRQLSGGSLKQIGVYLGGRDHSTVLHGCQKTEQLLGADPAIRSVVADMKTQLEGSCQA